MNVEDGQHVDFLRDCGPLINHCRVPILSTNLQGSVRCMVTRCGEWNWGKIPNLAPVEIASRIAAIKPPSGSEQDDLSSWAFSRNVRFTVKSAYQAVDQESLGREDGK